MASFSHRPFGPRYAFVVVGVIFLALLIAAGLRSSLSVMMLPLQDSFGWRRDEISLAAALGIFLYGMAGPFAAALMENFGLRRTLLLALLLMSASTALSLFMTQAWHLVATWGVMSGVGSGAVASVLGATVANRWFKTNRGLVMGLMSASSATGMLVFLPVLASLAQWGGWRPVAVAVSLATAAMIPLVLFLVPERPSSIGLTRYGADHTDVVAELPGNFLQVTFGTLARAAGTRVFWFLFITFFVCGFTTNGLVGTHLIAYCGDMGVPEVQAAGLLALMGVFDLIGTTASGWLTDRFDPRKLLAVYYGVRGLSLIYLPYSNFSAASLTVFAVLYGLDWIATVPPTLRLANESFGDRSGPMVFGWIAAGHQIGAACAAYFGGFMRELQGNYEIAFAIAGMTAVAAAALCMLIERPGLQRGFAQPQAA